MEERNRLPRCLSLKSRTEIDALFKDGRRYSGDFFTLVYQPAEEFRFGIFLSRTHGSAPERNRIKRLFREAVRTGGRQELKSGRVAILPRQIGKKAEYEAIKADVCRVFQRVRNNTNK